MSAPTVSNILAEVEVELRVAMRKHAPMHSPHEGHSVIREELEELWEHVKADSGTSPAARAEAIQLAAMACRYVHDLCSEAAPPRGIRCDNHDRVDCPICLRWADEVRHG